MASYELYYKPTCPFCIKVLDYMKGKGIEIPLHDISAEAGAREHLIEVGGKAQVPCLFIDGEAMYESGDIIAYLDENLA